MAAFEGIGGRDRHAPPRYQTPPANFATEPGGLILGHVAGGAAEKICPGTFRPSSWSPDGKVLLVSAGVRQETFLCDPGMGALTPILRHSSVSVHSAQFSRDGRWIAFHVTTSPITRRLFVMRYEGPRLYGESEWMPVSEGKAMDREPRWSPNGNVLYYLSTRDGNHCIWAQRLDPLTKRAVGEPASILHLHTARRVAQRRAGYGNYRPVGDVRPHHFCDARADWEYLDDEAGGVVGSHSASLSRSSKTLSFWNHEISRRRSESAGPAPRLRPVR
jgi:Tol biopolymer transport system component